MSQFLHKQREGDRQFKDRGPFGVPLLTPENPINLSAHLPEDIVFIAGGTLHISTYLSPPHPPTHPAGPHPLEVLIADELNLARGDRVVTQHHYLDGWALGAGLTTSATGVFPLSITSPRNGPNSRLVLLNAVRSPDDLLGLDLLEAAMLAHPDSLEVHHFCAEGVNATGGYTRGFAARFLHEGELDAEAVAEVLGGWAEEDEAQNEGMREPKRLGIVCSPSGFDAFAVDALAEAGVGNAFEGFAR
ncbi:hypothetical protein BDK51DRAFT_26692 [Blyttiomyces helicus]|uniref:Uncharacterized protein n=1 Tax=Blyttiomyces helicus TaxID=388810 RepID=A0A4P9W2I0_9FUNG|nr:hypothetical protein BDK51DRAFT_26692 [Blyttiomyces helicus]|eukprot:RKO85373.1 hypothetical protein BDK51DRAFT_26692 [Blyttiomyces helicus]